MADNFLKERVYIEDVEDMIKAIINHIGRPYPEDITDQVFQAIENNPELLRRYNLYAGDNFHGANAMIGKLVKDYTRLKVNSSCRNPKSTLIKSYTKLVN